MHCAHRFTTYERLEELPLMVVKSHKGRELFDRAKLLRGIRSACKGRPVSEDQLSAIAEDIEDEARLRGSDVTSAIIGLLTLDRLRVVDDVAYLRFASVYKNFDAAGDFVQELEILHKLHQSEVGDIVT